ncbi:MAG: hypothetical protein RLZZ123_639 [Pseudomonadota bacterium]
MSTPPTARAATTDWPEHVSVHQASDPARLASELARHIVGRLQHALNQRGRAQLAVSGGKSPVALFEALGQIDLDWARVMVTLVDDRQVPEAAQARLVSMVGPGLPASTQDWNERVSRADHALTELGPADVTVLGMGPDGHFASLFAGSPQLAQALDLQCVHACMAVTLPAPPAEAPFDRITQTLAHLARSGLWVLPLIGHEKMAVLRRSLPQTPMQSPVSALLQPTRTPLELWITP